MALTKKRQLFIDWYIKTHNASEAARKAGFSERIANRTGSFLMSNEDVKAEIDRREQIERERCKLDKDSYIKKTYELFEAEVNPQVKKQYWELLAKCNGWTDVNSIQVTNNVIQQLSPKEMKDKIEEIKNRLGSKSLKDIVLKTVKS